VAIAQEAVTTEDDVLLPAGCNAQCVPQCPDGSSPVNCLIDPCATARCGNGQQCVSDYCGGEQLLELAVPNLAGLMRRIKHHVCHTQLCCSPAEHYMQQVILRACSS
jgi:hypothetical protein